MPQAYLDTQVFVWLGQKPEKISAEAARHIYENFELFLSVASIWEMAIKVKIGKLKFDFDFSLDEFVATNISKHFISISPVSLKSIYKTLDLDLIHRDPFDRLIIAHSITENIPIISSDLIFDSYPIKRIW